MTMNQPICNQVLKIKLCTENVHTQDTAAVKHITRNVHFSQIFTFKITSISRLIFYIITKLQCKNLRYLKNECHIRVIKSTLSQQTCRHFSTIKWFQQFDKSI